jgi:hypothetical protein
LFFYNKRLAFCFFHTTLPLNQGECFNQSFFLSVFFVKSISRNTILYFLSLIAVLLLTQNAYAQGAKPAARVEIPKSVERKFRRDAARLVLRIASENGGLQHQSIHLPVQKVEELYKVLCSIYLQDATARSIEKCDVHTFPNPSIDHLIIIFSKSVRWAEPLRQGAYQTNNAQLNAILSRHQLVIEKYVLWDESQEAITIRPQTPLNMTALVSDFKKVEGVAAIELGVPKTAGNDIQATRIQGGWEIVFLLRFGSYIAGQGKTHSWKYRVTDAGLVQFMGDSGDPLPSWMSCFEKDDD